jgi:hypothetical protein
MDETQTLAALALRELLDNPDRNDWDELLAANRALIREIASCIFAEPDGGHPRSARPRRWALTWNFWRVGRRKGHAKMRLLVATLTIALLAGTASAQNAGGKGRNSSQNAGQQKADQQEKKAADNAYKAGLKIIPDPNEKYDPWRNIRRPQR